MAEENKQIATVKRTLADSVLERINAFQQDGSLKLPANYAVGNKIKSAWLILQDIKDRNGKNALEVCDPSSVANALLSMCVQALDPGLKQCYFIVYGNQLQLQRSYFGTIAVLLKANAIKCAPAANVIYEGDEFQYGIDPITGRTSVIKHGQSLENINDEKIIGAYAIVTFPDGTTDTTIMTMAQIKKSWMQSRNYASDNSTHKKFPAEMSKRTVINKALKTVINSLGDAWISSTKDEFDAAPQDSRSAMVEEAESTVIEDIDPETETAEAAPAEAAPAEERPKKPAKKAPAAEPEDNGDPY